MFKVLFSFFILMLCMLFILPKTLSAQVGVPTEEMMEGKIEKVTAESYLVRFDDGERVLVRKDTVQITGTPEYQVQDKVVVTKVDSVDGEVYYISNYVRRDGLMLLISVFVVLAVLVGGVWGATSLIGMSFSFLIIFKVLLPMILNGNNAVMAAVVSSFFIIPVTFVFSHGLKAKTLIAGAGTLVTLIITGFLAVVSVNMVKLTGFGSEEAAFLQFQLGEAVNMRGLLLAGMIISSLGVLDDITVSQASIVAELKSANKKYDSQKLFMSAMNVGRDHIASLINTLVLVYAGASLPLLLLFVTSDVGYSDLLNYEMIAEEIVRTLVGSMGLILAVPITTFLASYYYQRKLD